MHSEVSRAPFELMDIKQQRVESFLQQLPENRERKYDGIWKRFAELTTIPRTSGKEQAVAEYITTLGKTYQEKGLVGEVVRDEANNVYWILPASDAQYDTPESAIILQGHTDMVCKTADESINPSQHGVIPEIVHDGDEWIIQSKDNKTTLGADNGIMVSFLLELPALLQQEDIPHGQIKILLTTGEEAGFTGAKKLDPHVFDGYSTLLNIDSEEEDKITIGSAAIAPNIEMKLPVTKEPTYDNLVYQKLTIDGLYGGHSGMTIGDPHRENAIKLATEILAEIPDIHIADFSAPAELLNAIQDKATVTVGVKPESVSILQEKSQKVFDRIKEHEKTIAHIEVTNVEDEYKPTEIFTKESSQQVLTLLRELPQGIVTADPNGPACVQSIVDPATQKESTQFMTIQTVTCIARVTTLDTECIVNSMSRSATNQGLTEILQTITQTATSNGAEINIEDTAPAWEAIENSSLSQLIQERYHALFPDNEPLVEATTLGGLETSLFTKMKPGIICSSVGSIIYGAHTQGEKAKMASVERECTLVLDILKHFTLNALMQLTRREHRIA